MNGARPERPVSGTPMPDDIWDLITNCWSQQPEKRPTISTALSILRKICGYALPSLLEPLVPDSMENNQSYYSKPTPLLNNGRPCRTAAIAADLRLIAFESGRDGVVSVWDTETGRSWQLPPPRREGGLAESVGELVSLAFSPDSRRILGGSNNGNIYLWDIENGIPVTFRAHEDTVFAIAFSPDGTKIASGSEDFTVRIWKIDSQEYESVSCGVQVLSIAFSPDGKYIAAVSVDHDNYSQDDGLTIGLFDPDQLGKPLRTFPAGLSDAQCLTWSSDGSHLAAAFFDRHVRIWNVKSGAVVHLKSSHQESHPTRGGVELVAFSPNGKYVATGGYEGNIQIWDAHTGISVAGPFTDHRARIVSITFSPSGRHAISICARPEVKVWNVPDTFIIENPLPSASNTLEHMAEVIHVNADTNQVPEIPPSPLQYTIELSPSEDSLSLVPPHTPEPTNYSIGLVEDISPVPIAEPSPVAYSIDLIEVEIPSVPTAEPSPLSYSIDLCPSQDFMPSVPSDPPHLTHHPITAGEAIDQVPSADPSPITHSIELYPSED